MTPKKRAQRRMLVIAADSLLLAATLLTFADFHHVRISPMAPVTLSPQLPSATPASVQATPATPIPDPAATVTATETPVPTPTIDPNDLLRGQYADRFTDGEILETEDSYRSDTVSVTIHRVEKDAVTYYVADIYVKYIESFRAGLALEHSNRWMAARDIAEANDAIIAISGDFYGFRKTGTVAVRNGQEWIKKLPPENDLLVMYYDGRMETISAEEADVDAIYAEGPYQIWCFGPELLRDGRAITEFTSRIRGRNPRSAVGYFEPGHYCFMLVDGRQRGYSVGMTLGELAQAFEDLGCACAYNLDGGDTAVMVYQDEIYSRPDDDLRDVSDILYIREPAARSEGAGQ